jgi:hypothetical protein
VTTKLLVISPWIAAYRVRFYDRLQFALAQHRSHSMMCSWLSYAMMHRPAWPDAKTWAMVSGPETSRHRGSRSGAGRYRFVGSHRS